ncbi:class I SAM-dependent methyltransferase [Limnobacter sp.]|uniref:class I SAM-dependent methyltransferase n=1 Tax=Limnobacter sp. TaxID=2003368 RepID=UPI0025890726|nr:class I SAM-dependent methyltransferase [Limnobacter sp.]
MFSLRLGSARISPTALYTAQVWQENQRSVPELQSWASRALYSVLWPAMRTSQWFGGPTLTDFLLARHDLIDHCMTQAIDSGQISHVVEIAAGLSPRGCRYVNRYGSKLTYIEADLPAMAQQKANLLKDRLANNSNHHVVPIDAFQSKGDESLAGILARFKPMGGVAIVTEGLLNYFDRPSVLTLWHNIAEVAAAYPNSIYLSDLHFAGHNNDLASQLFAKALGYFVQGRVHLHFQNEAELQQALAPIALQCEVLDPRSFKQEIPACQARGAGLVRVLKMTLKA